MLNVNKDREQELMRVAKDVLSPEKYQEFFDNIMSHRDTMVKEDWQITTHTGEYESMQFSNKRVSKCSSEEKQQFWAYADKHVRMTVVEGVTMKHGTVTRLSDIVRLMCSSKYANVEKQKRKVMFSTSDGVRPIGDRGAMAWNGFQVIDLDLKDADLARALKKDIFDGLCREHWFLGTTVSSSGTGLHIWTKIEVPSDITFDQMQTLYALNFRHKYSAVYIQIERTHKELTPAKIISFMDFAMFKPQQGVFIPGQCPDISANFRSTELNFESIHNKDREYADYSWVTAPELLDTFTKWEWFANYKKNADDDIDYNNITATGEYSLNGIKIHYKHKERWQLANTLCSIYGFEKGSELLRSVVSDDVPSAELRGDMLTANNYNKPVSLWAVRTLNSVHGFNIKVDGIDTWTAKGRLAPKQNSSDEIYDLYKENQENVVEFHLKADQYLSDIAPQIKQSLGHMTLLEAGAGFGKTEMIKRLGGKVLLVLPFTSIIESKFNDTNEWECFFQKRSVTKTDLELYDKLCMTADKFSQLKMMDVNFSYFDYIVIDESHLLFLSEYRPVMSAVVDNIAHSTCNIILMTGTPSGETLFFPKMKHIVVTKEETRDKTFNVYFGNNRTDTRLQMADAMANAIVEGKKVLFPTNAGSLMYQTLVTDIDRFLFYKGFNRNLRAVYYKKANEGCEEMDKITFEKTIADLDLVACTSYLSVGVDICDKFDFEIFFDKLIIGQDIEQYANRLRNNNLHIQVFLPKNDDKGLPIDYDSVAPLSMKTDTPELTLGRDSVRMCNVSALRAKGEYRYNPIIQSVLRTDKYIQYSNDIGMYYVDETAFKLHIFEENYRYYAAQLPVIRQAMERYGYQCSSSDEFAFKVSAEMAEEIEALNKQARKTKYEEDTKQTFEFLRALDNNNIDWLLEGMNGRFKIQKEPALAKPFNLVDDILYLRCPDLFQKNMPIIKTLYKFYDFETIICIFDYCMSDKNYQVNYSMLRRVTKLISIEYNNRKGRVDVPVIKFMEDVKNWVEEESKRTKEEIEIFLKGCTVNYVKAAGEFLLANVNLIDHTYDMIVELFKVLVSKSKPTKQKGKAKKQYVLTQNKLLWTEKTNYSALYGNQNTKVFFIGDVLNGSVEDEEIQDIASEETLQIASDYEDVEINPDELDPSQVSNSFDYYAYEKDNTIIKDFFQKQIDSIETSVTEPSPDKEVVEEQPRQRDLFDN